MPLAKSSRSTSAVRRPRVAASSATPAPVIPPPTTSTSNCLVAESLEHRGAVERGSGHRPDARAGHHRARQRARTMVRSAAAMTITYDPKHAAYPDEADVRDELTRVFDVCDGCRRCLSLCTSFPSLFEMLDASVPAPGSATRAGSRRRSRTASSTSASSAGCAVANCPYVPGMHELAIDFPRSDGTGDGDAPRHRPAHDPDDRRRSAPRPHRLSSARLATRDRAGRSIGWSGPRPGTLRRRVLARVTGVTARRRLAPFAPATLLERRSGADRTTSGPAADRRVTVFPTCLVEYRRPEIGHRPRRRLRPASHRVRRRTGRMLRGAVADGGRHPPVRCSGGAQRHNARRRDSRRHRRRRRPTDLSRGDHHRLHRSRRRDRRRTGRRRTFDAVAYLADHVADQSRGSPVGLASTRPGSRASDGGDVDGSSTTNRVGRLGDEAPSPARRLLELTGADGRPMCTAARASTPDGRCASPTSRSVSPSPTSSAPRSNDQPPTWSPGACVHHQLVDRRTDRARVIHPFELLAGSTDSARRRERRRGDG